MTVITAGLKKSIYENTKAATRLKLL